MSKPRRAGRVNTPVFHRRINTPRSPGVNHISWRRLVQLIAQSFEIAVLLSGVEALELFGSVAAESRIAVFVLELLIILARLLGIAEAFIGLGGAQQCLLVQEWLIGELVGELIVQPGGSLEVFLRFFASARVAQLAQPFVETAPRFFQASEPALGLTF